MWSSTIFVGQEELALYILEGVPKFVNDIDGDVYGVTASIQFGRKLQNFCLNICLPTVLANIVGHVTNYIDRKFFHITITVNLTVMLVVTTM